MDKKDRPYKVLPYDSEWAKRFEQEKETLSGIFGQKAKRIEHIGSTSVEGLWAKPQIDILVLVDDLNSVDNFMDAMAANGYTYQSDYVWAHDEKYFSRDAGSGERLTSIHILPENSPKASEHIIFRNYLREHPEERDAYSKAKREVYESGADRVDYSSRKKETLEKLLMRAKEWSQNKHGRVNRNSF